MLYIVTYSEENPLGGIIRQTYSFNADNDTAAALEAADYGFQGYADKNNKYYDDEGFVMPKLSEVLQHIEDKCRDRNYIIHSIKNVTKSYDLVNYEADEEKDVTDEW